VCKPFALEPGSWKKFYSLDWGFAKPFSLGKWGVNGDGRAVRYGEWYGCEKNKADTGIRLGQSKIAAKAWKMALAEGVTEMVVDNAIFDKDGEGEAISEAFVRVGFRLIHSDKDRKNGLMKVHEMMMTDGHDGRPMLLVFDHCADFIRTIPLLLPDPNKPEDVDTKMEDHVYDEARYALMSDFVKNPTNALRRQNGQWRTEGRREREAWDPLRNRR
jgi:hypothetical protein